jgi:hypothetical protein
MPQVITSVSYLYNEMSLFANLRPGLELTKLDWEIGNPLKWKLLDPPTDVIYLQPSILENESDWLNDRVTQFQVKQIIASERSSFGLETKWNLEFEKALYSIAASYEFEYIAGKRGDLGDLQISALKSKLRSLHSLKAAPTVVQTADPCDIFRALMKTTYGLDILSVREPTASFALVTRAHAYPEGIFCIWTIFAVESMIGFL